MLQENIDFEKTEKILQKRLDRINAASTFDELKEDEQIIVKQENGWYLFWKLFVGFSKN